MQKNASSPRASEKASPAPAAPQLAKRLAFLELDDAACARIRTLRPVVERELKRGLEHFYERIRATPEVRVFFKDEAHIGNAKTSQLRHWDAISNGAFDARFFDDVRKVGNTHARIGLSPQWYIGGYAVVIDHLIKEVLREAWPAGFAGRRKARGEAVGASIGALVKAVLLDMDLAISIYLEALDERRRVAEDARQQADQAALDAVAAIAAGLSDLAAKKLNTRIVAELPETYRKLKVDFDAAATQLRVAMQGVVDGADAIHASSHEILHASEDLARRTEQQAANLEETAAALSGITVEVRKAAGGADQAQKIVKGARSEAESSSDVVRNAISAMGRIEKSSGEIGKIIGVVDEIAFQTNLLALNAGVEAARAGEFGRGFAVVASEVRALAQRSAEAAREIKGLVKSSSEEVANGVKLVGDTGESLTRIVAWVAQIETTVTQIAASTEEQSAGLSQVNTAMGQIDQLTQQNAAMAEQATAASRTLSNETERLADLVAQFGVERAGRTRRAAPPVVPVALAKPARAPAPRPAAPPRKVVNGAPDAEGWSEF